jgi:hypothetical protein
MTTTTREAMTHERSNNLLSLILPRFVNYKSDASAKPNAEKNSFLTEERNERKGDSKVMARPQQ